MCAYIYAHMHVSMYIYIYAHTSIYMHIYTHIYVYVYIERDKRRGEEVFFYCNSKTGISM